LQLISLDIPREAKRSWTSFKGPEITKDEFCPLKTCAVLSGKIPFGELGFTKIPHEQNPVRVIVSAPASSSESTAVAKGKTTLPAAADS
jgi:hypothetical protein